MMTRTFKRERVIFVLKFFILACRNTRIIQTIYTLFRIWIIHNDKGVEYMDTFGKGSYVEWKKYLF